MRKVSQLQVSSWFLKELVDIHWRTLLLEASQWLWRFTLPLLLVDGRCVQWIHQWKCWFHSWMQASWSDHCRWIDQQCILGQYQFKPLFQYGSKLVRTYSQDEFNVSDCMECMFLDSTLSLRSCWRMNHSLGAYFGSGEEIMMWCGLTTAFVYCIFYMIQKSSHSSLTHWTHKRTKRIRSMMIPTGWINLNFIFLMKTHSNFSDSTFLSANAPVKYMIFQPVDRSYSLVFLVSNIVEKLFNRGNKDFKDFPFISFNVVPVCCTLLCFLFIKKHHSWWWKRTDFRNHIYFCWIFHFWKLWIFYDRMNTHSSKVTSTSLVAACFKSVMKLDVIVTEDKPQDENDGCNEQDFFFCEHRWKSYGVKVGSHLSKQLFS